MSKPSRHPMLWFLILSILIACRTPLLAQTGSGLPLSGTITGPDGARLKDAKVILLGRNVTVRTDVNGRYTFAGVSIVPSQGLDVGVDGPSRGPRISSSMP
jgi:hypothetical protein